MSVKNFIIKNRYFDSVVLMAIASNLSKMEGIKSVAAMMGTENNKDVLRNTNMIDSAGEKAEPNDLIIGINTDNTELYDDVLNKFNEQLEKKDSDDDGKSNVEITSINEAIKNFPDSNLVIFSIPGGFVKREAKNALLADKNIMIFSDNVSIEEEKELKELAKERGLIVMGPDCGTAIINGKGLAFANAMPTGNVAIIGASGTGIQEVSVILANNNIGVKHAIGLGGRDLSKEIGGISMLSALDAIENDNDIDLVILISKPPYPAVEDKILDRVKNYKKKVLINFLKGNSEKCESLGLPFAATLEEAGRKAISIINKCELNTNEFDISTEKINKLIEGIKNKVKGKYVRGLYSGGTLCDETLYILTQKGIKTYSNIPLSPEFKIKNSNESIENTILDLGDDEFTKGRPHPMIDYNLRCERIVKEAENEDTGIILFDIVTGWGSHYTPVEPLEEAITEAKKKNPDCVFVSSVCGTKWDIQKVDELKNRLEKLGVIFMPTNAQAAKFISLILK